MRRVAVALIGARIPFDHRPISLFRHVDEFSAINPLLKAPTLVTSDGTVLMDSTLILDYLAVSEPAMAALTRCPPAARLKGLRAEGLALAVMEKAVQRHYERALRPPEKSHAPWIERVMSQLNAGLALLDAELPRAGWSKDVGRADIAAACALGFVRGTLLAEDAELGRYPNLMDFCDRAEILPAFRAAPAVDGVTAPLAIAD